MVNGALTRVAARRAGLVARAPGRDLSTAAPCWRAFRWGAAIVRILGKCGSFKFS